jgi:putative AbiEi antitoxin of type IV toxin-antitoxin system
VTDGEARRGAAQVARFGQFIAAGRSRSHVRRLVRDGRLTRVRRGIYAAGNAAAESPGQVRQQAVNLAAAIAASDARVVGSHRTAAVIHGLDLIGGNANGPVELTRSPGGAGSRSWRVDVRIHSAALPARHLTSKQGVVLTSVARTVVDLARACSFTEGVVAADSALRMQKTTLGEMRSVLADCARWPGVKRAREVVAFCDARAESALESIGRVAFRDYGLPAPSLQVEVGGDLGVIGRSDYLWPEYATIAEADGVLKYTSPNRAIKQLDRDARLRDAGFEVVHFTWQEITLVPEQVVARVRAAFARGQRALAQMAR